MKTNSLPYLPAMFATCMLFQVVYVICILLWTLAPNLQGHSLLETLLPGFKLLGVGSFFYGLVLTAVYGWVASLVFVFFYNLWPTIARVLFGQGRAE